MGGEATAPSPGSGLLRATVHVTAGNLVSRLSGFVRAVVVAAVLGATFLGNTYQTANLVSNFLFELLAAGVLYSVLVPPFVKLIDAGRRGDADRLAGAILGLALAVLGAVALVAVLARPWIMRALTMAVDDPVVRAEEIRLGSFLLIFFLPQLLLYAVGAVATALLQGDRRFAAPAFAPAANNVVVIATMAVFLALESSSGSAGLNLSGAQKLVLAVGTTFGVAVMALMPLVAAWRAGFRLRPRWDPRHSGLRELGRSGAWAAAYLALSQVLIVTTVVLANQVQGGVVAYQLAFTVFLLPYALLAQPTMTALYPRLAADWAVRRAGSFAAALRQGAGAIVFLIVPAAALMWAVAEPAVAVIRFANFDDAGIEMTAGLVQAYAVGVLGFAGFNLLTRAFYAADDTRTPTLVNACVTVGGSVLMVVLFLLARGDDRVAMLGVGYSAAVLAAAGALLLLVRRATGQPCMAGGSLARAVSGGVLAAAAGRVVTEVLPAGGRTDSLVAVALGSTAAVAVYLIWQWLLHAPELRGLLERVSGSARAARAGAAPAP